MEMFTPACNCLPINRPYTLPPSVHQTSNCGTVAITIRCSHNVTHYDRNDNEKDIYLSRAYLNVSDSEMHVAYTYGVMTFRVTSLSVTYHIHMYVRT